MLYLHPRYRENSSYFTRVALGMTVEVSLLLRAYILQAVCGKHWALLQALKPTIYSQKSRELMRCSWRHVHSKHNGIFQLKPWVCHFITAPPYLLYRMECVQAERWISSTCRTLNCWLCTQRTLMLRNPYWTSWEELRDLCPKSVYL